MSKTIKNLKSGNYEVVDSQGVSITTHFIECLEKEFADLEAKLAESEKKLDNVINSIRTNTLIDMENKEMLELENVNLKNELSELKQKAIVPKFQIGQTLYMIPTQFNGLTKIKEYNLLSVGLSDIGIRYDIALKEKERGIEPYYCASEDMFGKSIFATREEAEQKLAEIKGVKLCDK